jgi:uncharacterized protein YcgL (UPF0745 family)
LRLGESGLSFIMTVDVYQTNKKDIYLFLRSGEPFSSVPQPVRDTVELLQFLNDMELAPDKPEAQHSEILAELEKQGYSIHGARFRITEHG